MRGTLGRNASKLRSLLRKLPFFIFLEDKSIKMLMHQIHILSPLHASRSASRQRMSTWIVKRLELPAITSPMSQPDSKAEAEGALELF
ncbi:hypothetical protein PIB30_081531 [Stylosanthes scabra]|uniref:Uncharacterized protein n=1 Tax=Stylosanthes scabra TaxID=79078 RepID=A0ABU6YPZ0_9FABA|nr:hypothetical protein [Stylosanthes scabra]